MGDRERVLQAVYSGVEEANALLPKEQQLDKSPETIIVSEAEGLDSLGLVNLIVAIESKIEAEFDSSVTLADKITVLEENNPFRTIGTLTDYISMLLKDSKDD